MPSSSPPTSALGRSVLRFDGVIVEDAHQNIVQVVDLATQLPAAADAVLHVGCDPRVTG